MKPENIGKYELVESLGRGGMGEVWKALDTQLRRYVAIKLLHANLQFDPDFLAHFTREAQLVASLHHPNIVQIHDFQRFTAQDTPIKAYMVMDYIEGGTLADYIRETSRKSLFPAPTDVIYLLTKISLALDYAHQQGMIHRDIKPANILLDTSQSVQQTAGEPILTDFGIAKLQKTQSSTITRAMVGTPLYISPEQARGGTLDARSDLYSLGIVLYELLTGVTPFRGNNPMTIMMQHIYEMPTPPALINPHIPPMLSSVILQSISKDPDARFPTASAMTVAVAQAFNLPVPTTFVQERSPEQGTTRNETTNSRSQASFEMPVDTLHATFTPSLPTLSPTPAPQNVSLQSHPLPQGSAFTKQKNIVLAFVVCIVLLLVSVSIFAAYPLILAGHTTIQQSSPTGSITGKIAFSSSTQAAQHIFDQVQVDLNHVPSPSVGKVYYAWLENSMGETAEYPHWKLEIVNGMIYTLYTSSPKGTDLFTQSSLFLITEETSTIAPIIPIPEPSLHKYYADISHSASVSVSPSFEVKPCPSGATANPCI